MLYHALKLYKLSPELRWVAGGYIWAVDQVVDLLPDDDCPAGLRSPFSVLNGSRSPPRRPTLSSVSEAGDPPVDDLRTRVMKSGAVPISETDVYVLSDPASTGPITREKVPFVQHGELEKLVVNVMLVVFVP